jgi:hypothetical protein
MRHVGMVVIVMLLNGCGGGSGGQGAGNVPPPPQGAPPPPDTLFAQYAVSLGTYPGCPKSLDSGTAACWCSAVHRRRHAVTPMVCR